MTIYKKASQRLLNLANDILCNVELHRPLLDAKVRIDILLAYAEIDEKTGERIGFALKKNGIRAYGITRKIGLKDRVKGMGDVEIALDGDWWEEADEEEQRALLDHELTHIAIKDGKTDDIKRPIIVLRNHDYEFGWFKSIAARYPRSIERQQASYLMDTAGQYFWPSIAPQPSKP